MASPPQTEYWVDPYWRVRRLTPFQLMVHDIRIVPWTGESDSAEPMLEINEVLPSAFAPNHEERNWLRNTIDMEWLSSNRTEHVKLEAQLMEYGWLNCLRSQGVQKHVNDPPELRKCRWIHIPSKFPEYLQGALLGLSDWSRDRQRILSSLRQLEHCIYQNERFSKHGKYFSPFFQPLGSQSKTDDQPTTGDGTHHHDVPMIMSISFLDWGVSGPTPPLRFQIDPREYNQSSRHSAHLLRSILQHFYRLEDTSDREKSQAFCKHRPWTSDRELDLKVRRWYGHYPRGLNVDELWVLVVDARHIVTFSSNQTWKSRWPPLQLTSRIAEVSFRGIRNSFLASEERNEYTAYTHVIVCLNGAVGLLHRSFWRDITLCLTDRYASYLGHLQYRLHRAPSTKLVMDLLQVQEELNIIIKLLEQQIELISDYQDFFRGYCKPIQDNESEETRSVTRFSANQPGGRLMSLPERATFRLHSTSSLADPMSQLLEGLRIEYVDLCDLRDNSNNLVNRTVQLVNIRLEDHGKAILVFTIVTIIFLPLSFVTSFFGMNVADIRSMSSTQGLFWIVAGALTASVVALALFLAFYGGWIFQSILNFKEGRRRNEDREFSHSSEPHTEPTGIFKRFSAGLRRRSPSEKLDQQFRVLGAKRLGDDSVI